MSAKLYRVSPKQLAYYKKQREESTKSNSNLTQRLLLEFNLTYSTSKILTEKVMDPSVPFSDIFVEVETSQEIALPSHDDDQRQNVYLPQEVYDFLEKKLSEALEGEDFYENFDSRQLDFQKNHSLVDKIAAEFPDRYPKGGDDLEKLRDLADERFINFSPSKVSDVDTLETLREFFGSSQNEGASTEEIMKRWLQILPASRKGRAAFYFAAGDFLYDQAERIVEEVKSSVE